MTQVEDRSPVRVEQDDHLLARIRRHAEHSPDRPILAIPADGEWRELSWSALNARVRDVAAGLVARGVERGDRVALMSPTRAEWTLTDLAVLSAGAVTVPLYHTSSVEQCRMILRDAGVRLAIAAGDELADRLREAHDVEVVILDDDGLDRLAAEAGDDDRADVDRRVHNLTHDDIATIVYTSGTTGDPKGCVLTHGNLAWTTSQTRHQLEGVLREGGTLLQMLPLAHIFARVIQFVCLDANLVVGFPSTASDPREDVRSFRPSLFVGVPRAFEKIYEAARQQARGKVRQRIFRFAVATAQAWSRSERHRPVLRARRVIADRLVFSRLRAALGGRVRHCVSGGAPLSTDLVHFFHGAGIPIYEGYGLTETTGPATVNAPDALRVGSAGRPLPGTRIRVDDGEILVRGGHVFQRYFHDEGRTDEDFDGDWFRTGDLGEVDDDGFLYVKDRKKELIVTASGKNIAPVPLEDRVNRHPLVSQSMLVGDQRRFVAVLVTLDDAELASFARERGLDGERDELIAHEEIRAEVSKAVDEANTLVSEAESIRQFVILPREFLEERGELTPTLKLKRQDIAEHFSDEIDSI
ncbi:long-chain fatty acid--CoA ligase [Phytoactinopolyspora alkaliphila]|uniref:Acyl-CoA synthetase n=1 Tax=Phytoactinopolyspora alkaliphila TaxID=1783498 RepID=A0A6N9YQ14_9ACTN|nr:long-chain fatty acid--CoA ligase [Phytoactinopolyspora alkaliphila]NED96919.1 long-chain fatty acid--CoA ligase [Phytoactinopolyspora alkaliphila]